MVMERNTHSGRRHEMWSFGSGFSARPVVVLSVLCSRLLLVAITSSQQSSSVGFSSMRPHTSCSSTWCWYAFRTARVLVEKAGDTPNPPAGRGDVSKPAALVNVSTSRARASHGHSVRADSVEGGGIIEQTPDIVVRRPQPLVGSGSETTVSIKMGHFDYPLGFICVEGDQHVSESRPTA